MSAPVSMPASVQPQQPSPSPAAVSVWQKVHAYRRLLLIALAVFTLDQASKFWIGTHLPLGAYYPPQAITVIDGFFYIVHVGNTGAAWSILSGQRGLLAGLALLTLGGIYFWRHSLGLRQSAVQVSFGLLCGGIAGNLLDRIVHGHVVDFLDFHFGSYVYPTFNLADSGICVGVAIYLINALLQPAPPVKN